MGTSRQITHLKFFNTSSKHITKSQVKIWVWLSSRSNTLNSKQNQAQKSYLSIYISLNSPLTDILSNMFFTVYSVQNQSTNKSQIHCYDTHHLHNTILPINICHQLYSVPNQNTRQRKIRCHDTHYLHSTIQIHCHATHYLHSTIISVNISIFREL